jgi:hypothetical protein
MKGYSFLNQKEEIFKKEQRVNKRYGYNCTFKVESANLKKLDLEVKGIDISISGIGFISDIEFRINDMLEIAFKYNNVTIPAIVEVRHVNLYDFGFAVGCQFVALQDMYRAVLKDLDIS